MKSYRHIFFDLDHTLWDFERASSETLADLYKKYNLEFHSDFSSLMFTEKFSQVNREIWKQFDEGKISREKLRDIRFRIIFNELGYENEELGKTIATEYLKICPQKGHLIPDALEILNYLFPKYSLHIITNGFEEVQLQKIKSAGIASFFSEIITSERSGFRKPEKGIFEYALKKTNAAASEAIMIGDSLEADILGANSVSMDSVFFNHHKISNFIKLKFEISSLSELKRIL